MPSELSPPFEIACRVAAALEDLGVPYFLGGSLASSIHGEPRATNDIDLVVDLRADLVDDLARRLGSDFEVDEEALRDAVLRRSSWNLFYLPLLLKIDLFQCGASPFDREELARRQVIELGPQRRLYVKTPEDSVLRKLLWYRQGEGVSEKQWRDVVEILRVGRTLDQAHLARWAAALGIEDLLSRALTSAATPRSD